LRFGRILRTYFLTSSESSGCFRFIGSYVLTSGVGGGLSSGSQPSLTGCWHRNLYFLFRLCFHFRFEQYCVSGITLIPRPSRARDLVTLGEVGSARHTSLERVTTGAGSVSRGARAKPNSLDRSVRPSLSGGVVSITFYPRTRNFTVGKCRITLVPIYATTNSVFITIQC